MKTFIGIDPGLEGGISLIQIETKGEDEYTSYSMLDEGDWRKMLNLGFLLSKSSSHTFIFIEKQQYRLGQKGVYNTLVNYGKILGYIPYVFTKGYELREVESTVWTSKLKILKNSTDKKPSILWLREHNTKAYDSLLETAGKRSVKSYNGVADAFCIAIYGMRSYGY